MWDFIVLGEVPGTQVQVSFSFWLVFVAALVMSLMLVSLVRILVSNHALAVLRINRILQTAAYSQWLITRRHIQA
jgi:hypothetical protein